MTETPVSGSGPGSDVLKLWASQRTITHVCARGSVGRHFLTKIPTCLAVGLLMYGQRI